MQVTLKNNDGIFHNIMCCAQSKHIEGFVDDMYCRGFVRSTITTYTCNVRHFLEYTNCVEEATYEDLKRYLTHLKQINRAPSTLNGHFCAINAYFDYLDFTRGTRNNIVPVFRDRYLRLKKQYHYNNTRQVIDISTMKELLAAPDDERPDRIIHNYVRTAPIRDKAIMTLLEKTAMRRGESMALTEDDILLDEGEVWINPKFRKRTMCLAFIDKETKQLMQEYLEWRKNVVKQGNNSLWITHTGAPLHKDDMYYITTHYAKKIGIHNHKGPLIERFTPHCFRHCWTTHMRQAGMPKDFRQWLRGDAPKDAEDLYNRIKPPEAKKMYLKCVPQLL
ncbi:tyrosine-type recombinase/integrase [Methanolobus sp. ZRKC5]|uniref:tyrosine-type recombinase/integrase n=1 Tax=unclassified Methanolobus TaxID=2629569 RepID=UPI00313B030F